MRGIALFIFSAGFALAGSFQHPGLLQSMADLERMKSAVARGAEPWKSGFEKLEAHPQSQPTYEMKGPFEEIARNPTAHQREFDMDANAAYQLAILWAITGDPAYAKQAARIIDAWAATLKRVSGRDAVLAASLSPFKMINAAEILRYTRSGWPETKARKAGEMFAAVFYPVLENFALFANGNWDTGAIKAMMAIAVYRDDREMFERALRYYVDGAGDGRLTHYIYESGECQESGRDQQHTQLGLAHLGDAAEIAWHQGLDLYGYADNRLLKGFEYTARYNLGEDVPFAPDIDQTGKYSHRRISPRGPLRPVYEQIFNHFVNRMGIPAPFTQRAAEKLRPEGAAFGADHTGFGTLLYSRLPGPEKWTQPGPSGGLVAEGAASQIKLSWIPSRGAAAYTIQRAEGDSGPFQTIARTSLASYADSTVIAGRVYRYMVSGSVPIRVSAGLPAPWSQHGPASAQFDGRAFRIDAPAGFQFVDAPFGGDGTIIARFVPQVASAFARFGLMVEASLADDAPAVQLLITPGPGGQPERRNWSVSFAGTEVPLAAPLVSDGRLMQPCWLKLERAGRRFTGSFSPDGRTWTRVAETTVPLERGVFIGLAASSGIANISTAIVFDPVSLRTD
jgi:hypothetical protein